MELIDKTRVIQSILSKFGVRTAHMLRDFLEKYPTIEAIPKEQYEAKLKADMVAMLTELQLEIEEKATEICDDGWWLTYNWLIQQKIDKLKGVEE